MSRIDAITNGTLLAGVKVVEKFLDANDTSESSHDRIHLSNGTCLATPFNRPEARYFDEAYLPQAPWRSPTSKERQLLTTTETPHDFSQTVSLIKIPTHILEAFRHIGMEEVKNREEYYELMAQPQGNAAVEGFADYVRSFIIKKDDFQIIRIYNKPGLVTATYVHDPKEDLFLGLHVDFLHKQSIHGRDKSPNRISLNLGAEDRYFLFINLPLNEIVEIVNPPPEWETEELALNFMKKYPQYPVVKVRVKPGEAYIAPTQNIIHDGIGSKNTTDFNLTIIGHVALVPPELASASASAHG